MERSPGGSITEGIGQGRVTGNLATCEGIIDGAFLVRFACVNVVQEIFRFAHCLFFLFFFFLVRNFALITC